MKKTLFFLAAALTFGFAANAQTIFSEDFDAVTVSSQTGLGELPDGWTLYEDNLNNYSTSEGGYTAFGKSWKVYDMDGDNMAISITYTMEGTACDRWLITPAITIPTEGDYKLLFDQVASQYSERMSVKVSTTNTEKASFTQTLIDNELLAAGLSKRLLDLSSFAGQTIYIAFIAQTADGLYMAVDDVQVKVVVPNAVSAVASAAPIWSVLNGDIRTRLAVLNEGLAPLTSFDITYTVNGGAEQTISATGLNVAPFEYYVHTFNVATAGVGENVIEIVVSNPNGETNPDDCVDSTSCSTTVYDPATTATRTTLLEHFTTGACQYCPGGHNRLEQAIAGYEDKVAWVAHHVGYGTDNMTIDASDEVAGHFTANSLDSWVPGLYCTIYTEEQGGTWAPAMALDRTQLYASGANEDGVVGEVGDVSTLVNQFANATIAPSYVSIAMSGLTYDPQTRQLSVTISGEFLADYAGTQPRLSLYITPWDNGPLFNIDYERGIKGVWDSNIGYERWEFDGVWKIPLRSLSLLNLRVGGGFYTRKETSYFVDFANFRDDNVPGGWEDDWTGQFQLLRSSWYNASDFYIRSNLSFESPMLFATWLPLVGRAIESERLYLSGLILDDTRPYFEVGYGLSNRYFSGGIFASFLSSEFQEIGAKITFELFRKW